MNLETRTRIEKGEEKTSVYFEAQKRIYFLTKMIEEINNELHIVHQELTDSNKDKAKTEKYIADLVEIRESMRVQKAGVEFSLGKSSQKEGRA